VTLSAAVAGYDHVLLDLDGCVWVGEAPTPGAPEAVAALRQAGKRLLFLTNDPRHTAEELVRKLWRLGFQASMDEIASVGAAVQHHLATRRSGGSAFVIGAQALVDHVAAAGLRIVNNTDLAPRADVVVVAAHEAFDYRELRIAVQAVLRGAELLGATRDATFPMPDGPWPGTGPILAAVETATGARAATLGKPEAAFYAAALERLGPGRALGVGDSLATDVRGAAAAGIDAALVLTGSTTREEALAAGDPRPQHVAASLGALVLAPAE
jgi:HAD superfamily hydrolase (TIGR01450 family)